VEREGGRDDDRVVVSSEFTSWHLTLDIPHREGDPVAEHRDTATTTAMLIVCAYHYL
jgi:hypothetical protein